MRREYYILKSILCLQFILILGVNLNAEIKISGKVVSETGEEIPFATINLTDHNSGVTANMNGEFAIDGEFSNSKVTLEVSSVGYKTKIYQASISNQLSKDNIIELLEDINQLSEVIVSGEFKPTPADSSIYKVKLITSKKIQESGSLNLSELLTSEANIRLSNDGVLGTQIEMLGMSGQNVKIMIDGVPVIGRLDGNIDLSQINLANVEQVEVIEGPMSVVYGNNALAGTVNLITKRNRFHKLQSSINLYAESVGRYSGDIDISKKFGDHTISADGGYEHFSGVDFDESDRSMDWKPKNLSRANLNYDLRRSNWTLHSKIGYYSDKILYEGDIIENYKAFDTYYYTQRLDANVSVDKKWKDHSSLNVLASYNYYNRSEQDYYKDLRTLEKIWDDKEETQVTDQKMVRAIFWHDLSPEKLSFQSGIDFNIESMSGPRIVGGDQELGDYAAFINLKYKPWESFELQPGLRYSYNTDYSSPLVYSINTKWDLGDLILWRASAAKGFRAPNIKELYYEFIDSNHEIFGNPDLEAEESYNFNTTVEFSHLINENKISFTASVYYNNIDNMISLIQQGEESTAYLYQNVEKYETIGGNIEATGSLNNMISGRVGYGVTGRYNSYTETDGGNKFNISHDYFAGININESYTKIRANIDYKYSGQIPFLYTDSDTGAVVEGVQDPYHTMNIALTRKLLGGRLQLTAGAKNIFDVTTVNQSSASGTSAHSGGSGGVPISYGRSYFIGTKFRIYK